MIGGTTRLTPDREGGGAFSRATFPAVRLGMSRENGFRGQGIWRRPTRLPSASFTEAINLPPPTSVIVWCVVAPASPSACSVWWMSSTCQ